MADKVPVKVLYQSWFKDGRFTVWWDLQVDLPPSGIAGLLPILFEQLTTANPTEEWAIKHRERFLRSPRVGDVLMVGETTWKVTGPYEWERVWLQANQVVLIPGLTRMRERQSMCNRWRGNWPAFVARDLAMQAAGDNGPRLPIPPGGNVADP